VSEPEFLLLPDLPPAVLALADGGISIGAAGSTTGEVVFNTALTGYQEILTDPSYRRQIVTLTYPHIGNYGVNHEDAEARSVHAAGLVIRDLPIRSSNFRQSLTLDAYLRQEGTVAIADPPSAQHRCAERLHCNIRRGSRRLAS
jgi:carbamoyl-phosphate synthase small subunit